MRIGRESHGDDAHIGMLGVLAPERPKNDDADSENQRLANCPEETQSLASIVGLTLSIIRATTTRNCVRTLVPASAWAAWRKRTSADPFTQASRRSEIATAAPTGMAHAPNLPTSPTRIAKALATSWRKMVGLGSV